MPKVILVKKITNEQPVRRCLNCGKDISNKRKDAKFCSKTCWTSFNIDGTFTNRFYN